MKTPKEILIDIQNDIIQETCLDNVCIFAIGSYARGDATPNSDLDFIIVSSENKEFSDIREIVNKYLSKYHIPLNNFEGIYDRVFRTEDFLIKSGDSEERIFQITARYCLLYESFPIIDTEYYNILKRKIFENYSIKEKNKGLSFQDYIESDLIRGYFSIKLNTIKNFACSQHPLKWGKRIAKLVFVRKINFFINLMFIRLHNNNLEFDLFNNFSSLHTNERLKLIIANESNQEIINLYMNGLEYIINNEFCNEIEMKYLNGISDKIIEKIILNIENKEIAYDYRYFW
jgi:predicted nucleotidyltransferase